MATSTRSTSAHSTNSNARARDANDASRAMRTMRTMRTLVRALARALAFVVLAFAIARARSERATARSAREARASERGGERAIGSIADDGVAIGARGGTELASAALENALPKALKRKFYVIKSRVRRVSEDPDVLNVLWLNDLPNDPESAHLRDDASRARFAAFVFVSEWQKRMYEEYFGRAFERSVVMRNAIEPFERQIKKRPEDSVMRLIYHTTPHRGLEILIPVFEDIYERFDGKIILDVYSSFSIYGWGERDAQYEELFEKCRVHPGCNYRGAVSNEDVREALRKAHIYAYPSIWPETSCISAIEALSAGLDVVTSSLGALPETLSGFAYMYQYVHDKEEHAQLFKDALSHAITNYWSPESEKRRRTQQMYVGQEFNWGTAGFHGRIDEWIRFLGSLHKEFSGENPIMRQSYDSDSDYISALNVAARVTEANKRDSVGAIHLYEKVLKLDPKNQFALLASGNLKLMTGASARDAKQTQEGVDLLEYAVNNADELNPPLSRDSVAYYGAAVRSGYFRLEQQQGDIGYASFDLAEASRFPADDCWVMFRTTSVLHLPRSLTEERETVSNFSAGLDALLQRRDMHCDNFASISSAFALAYYDADYRMGYSRWVQLNFLAFPMLAYKAKQLKQVQIGDEVPLNYYSELEKRKIRLGVVSSFFTGQSSIWGNFGWTMQQLQIDERFEVDFLYYPREPISDMDVRLSLRSENNVYLDRIHTYEHIVKNRGLVENQRYDVLLYLDLHMTTEMHKLAMSKLAPVQITTHGHPVTSGIPRDIMDYFLSWDLAELPQAQQSYTEELLLIHSENKAWELYVPRTDGRERSLVGGGLSFGEYTRHNLDFIPEGLSQELLRDPTAKWYFCAQPSFKYHMTFDKILGDIQKRDPNAVLILMELDDPNHPELRHLHPKITSRLKKVGSVDLSRVAFVPRMSHYRLMAMYKLSDVILDSVYFGGDTTTREAFEVGAPIVTLPGKTLGQRWTQAYYRVLGILDFIAKDPTDYVRIAVRVANSSAAEKQAIRESIKNAATTKLFGNRGAAKLWADAIIDVARRPKYFYWSVPGNANDAATRRDEL